MIKDLIVLVPDKNTQSTVKGILPRHQSLKIREIKYDIFVHPLRDPGVYNHAVEFLRELLNQYDYALVFLDREGSGQEIKKASDISNELKRNLEINGWQDNAEVIVFDPELEIWAWTDSPHTANAAGWEDYSTLRAHLIEKKFWQQDYQKPERPKEALEFALKEKRIPRSSSIYQEIAEKVNFNLCTDPSFKKFRTVLRCWFAI